MPLLLNLLNDGYNVQLLLTPISDELLPLSYLETLTAEQKQEPTTWFESQGAPLDYFDLIVKKVSIENTLHVENFIVSLGKNKHQINFGKEIKLLHEAMKRPWAIALNGTVFEFTVRFYRHARFLPLKGWRRTNVLMELTHNKTRAGVNVKEKEAYDVVSITDENRAVTNPFFLKKTNFCNRVRLDRSEWIAGFQEIRLNTREAVFDNNKTLGDSEFDIFLGEDGVPTVEICVDDFNTEYQKQIGTGTATFLLASWLKMFILLGLLML